MIPRRDGFAVVAGPAVRGQGGLGRAIGDFAYGLEHRGFDVEVVGAQPPGALARLAGTRVGRRTAGSAARRLELRGVRHALAGTTAGLTYVTPGVVPTSHAGPLILHQANHHPVVEWERISRGARETGGRPDLVRSEARRRESEIEQVDLIHVSSAAVRDEFLDHGVAAERLVHVPLGVDLQEFRPNAKPSRPAIGAVGAFSMQKGVDRLAAVSERMRPQWTFHGVGGPVCPWSRRCFERAALVGHRAVPEMLADVQVLLMPSRSDGFGYVVLEALACGVVPIVTPEVGAAEVVRRLDPRLVVRGEDFAEAVPPLLEELDLEQLSRQAAVLAREFDRRVMAVRAVDGTLAALGLDAP